MYLLIYKTFYILFHALYSVIEYFATIIHSVYLKVSPSRYRHEILCKNKLNTISKLPKHVTILLSGEQPSYTDLANYVLWCIASQIQFISFYDHTGESTDFRGIFNKNSLSGVLNANEKKLEEEINQRKQPSDNVVWYRKNNEHKNGYSGRKIYLKILEEFDGKQSVVNACKSIASSTHSAKNIDINYMSMLISKRFEFPDPDLGIYCGNILKLYNYPPWQIRVTEFLPINTHHKVTVDLFINCLLKYGRCEQRLGK